MKRRIFRVISALMSVVMLMFSGVMPLSIAADEGTFPGNGVLNITGQYAKINRSDIAEGQVVHNGDELSIGLAWELESDSFAPPVTFEYDMSDELKGISLKEQTVPVADPDTGRVTAIYTISGQTIYIQLLEGISGRRGDCELSGVIDLSSAQVDENGDFTIEYFGKTLDLNTPDTTPTFSVSKWDSSFRESGGKYYQDFTIQVRSTNNIAARNVTVKDIFPVGEGSVYTGAAFLNGSSVNPAVSDGSASFDILIDNVSADYNSPSEITYSLELNPENVLKDGQFGIVKDNKAEVYYKDEKRTETTAYPNLPTADISKTGVIDAGDKSKINWTITIDPGILEDSGFIVTDTPDVKLALAGVAASIPGASVNSDGVSVNIPKSAFSFSDGKYILNYTTDMADMYANSISSVTFANEAKVKFDEYNFEKTATASVPTVPDVTDYISKTCKSVSGDTITWEVSVTIPNSDKIEKVKLEDNTFGYGLENSGKHYFDLESIKVYNKNGVLVDNSEAFSFDSSYNNNQLMLPVLKSDFVNANKDGTVTFVYDTEMQEVHSKKYKNEVKLTIELTDGTDDITDSADDIYTLPLSSDKNAYNNLYEMLSSEEIAEKIHPLAWEVRVNAYGHTYNTGDTIVIKDVLPEGFAYGNAVKFGVFNGWVNYNDNTISDCLSASAGTQGDLNTVTFTITVSDALKDKINVSGSYISVIYVTEMTKEYASGFDTASQSETFTNNAKVVVNDEKIADVQATQTIEPTPDNIVVKSISSQGTNASGAYANYSIDVNKKEVQIGSEATITVTDKLGSRLELVSGSVSITPSDDASFVYNTEDNTITFTLKNSRYYKITYGVKVRQISPPAAGTAADPEDINEKFANTVTVTGRGANNVSDITLIDNGTYYAAGSYEHDNYIKLRGSKFWSSEVQGNVIPDSVEIVITRTKNGIPDPTFSSTFNVTPDAQGKWEFVTEQLITKDAEGNEYAYNVQEQSVEGYVASYKLDGTAISADAYIDKSSGTANTAVKELVITNTFSPVKTNVTINKKWSDNTPGDKKPNKITITLYDLYGNSYVDTIDYANNKTKAEFADIPVYKYALSGGAVGKTPIKYYVLETAEGEDAGLLNSFTPEYPGTEDTVSGKKVFTLESITSYDILNTYNGGGTQSGPSVTTPETTTTTTVPGVTTTTTTTTTTPNTTTTTTTTTPNTTVTTTTSDTTTTTTTTSDTTTTATTTTSQPVVTTTPQSSVTPNTTVPVRPVITTTTTTAVTTTTTAATTPSVTTEKTTNTTRPPEEDEDEIEIDDDIDDSDDYIDEIPDDDDDEYYDPGDSTISTEITDEENPNTGIVLNWQLLASAVFAAAAILPQRKKKKN